MKVARKFTAEEVGLIHRTSMKGASRDDVDLFVATCERTGLDPFARQIMPSSRNVNKNGTWVAVWTWIVTIDGLRKIAVDSGDYEGQEGPWWCGPDGVWKEIWTDPKNPCFAAKVLVHRKNFRVGLPGIAKYSAYVQKKKDGQPNQVWETLGDHMTAKCAEALALRRAYPNEMAGLYTEDEEGAPEIIQAVIDAPPAVVEWSDADREEAQHQISNMMELLLECGWTEEEAKARTAKQKMAIGDVEIDYDRWFTRYLTLDAKIRAEIKAKEIPADLIAGASAHDA